VVGRGTVTTSPPKTTTTPDSTTTNDTKVPPAVGPQATDGHR
jgi:hypothetical protein